MLNKLIERLNSEELIGFFKRQDIIFLHLEEKDYNILRQIRMSGNVFIYASKDDFINTPLTWGIAMEVYNLRMKVTAGIRV